EGKELDKAADELETVMNGTKDHELALVARVRLARVEIAQGKPDEALTTLNAVEAGAFAARYHEVRGDAWYAKGDKAAALKEYRSAAGNPDLGDAALLDLKIADLAADAPPASAATVAAPAASAKQSMRNPLRTIWMVALLVGCAAGAKEKTIDEPAKLAPVTWTLRVDRVWSASVDTKKSLPLRLHLSLAVDEGRVYAAGHKGEVIAFELASGRV